ncbi:MAG TPA: transglutaminase family protein [Magnetospirillaceae bacterium]|jgi:transglutaminase-like putative cysteine protease
MTPSALVKVRHRTTYRYDQLVSLLPHRLMLRPREGPNIQIISMDLKVTPEASVTWSWDVFGNSIATATPQFMARTLLIESTVELGLSSAAYPVFDIAPSAVFYPFRYTDDEWTDLGALAVQQYPDPGFRLKNWTLNFVRGSPTDTLALLKDLNAGISSFISYQSRDEEGTQSPLYTLDRTWGSCRDIALLFVEAARSLGFGARLVSGYLHDPERPITGSGGTGTTHAWAEVYVPGPGWIAFDPTHRRVGSFNLIPVAVGRDIRQIMPVAGSFIGMSYAFQDMRVEVCITG